MMIRHQLQVTSYGGSGTTAMYEHLAGLDCDLPRSHDWRPFKHQRVPPRDADVPVGFRTIYLFGNPVLAVLSIFRRGYQYHHFRRMYAGKPNPPPAAAERLESIESFCSGGIDDFQIENHLQSWLQARRAYPILLVRYEDLAETWSEVATFLHLPDAAPAFPFRPRASQLDALPEHLVRSLSLMLQPALSMWEVLPPLMHKP